MPVKTSMITQMANDRCASRHIQGQRSEILDLLVGNQPLGADVTVVVLFCLCSRYSRSHHRAECSQKNDSVPPSSKIMNFDAIQV